LILVPICLILICGYVLFRNYDIFPPDKMSSSKEPPPGSVAAKLSELPDSQESETAKKQFLDEYKLFFGNEDFNSQMADCDDLFPVYRSGKEVEDFISKSLIELFKGPSETERGQGYYTSINPGVRLLGISRKKGTVYADFSRELEENVAGSCRTMAIRAQINETLTQFEGVDRVIILVEGSPGGVLQP
jgi:spore germination protein GerM